jgi:predicted esterase
MQNAWDKYQPFRDYLADQSLAPASIAGAAVFTVQDTTGPVEKLYTAVQATPLPTLTDLTLCANGVTSPCADGDSRICGAADPDFYEIHGRFAVPTYQQGTTPYATPADGGKIAFDANDLPVQNGSFDVCMVMMIPKQATPPANGWPMVIYAHGTGGTFRGVVTNGAGRAIVTGSTPAAVLSFDGVVHGDRRAGHSRDEDSLMFNVINPAAARDNNLQGAVDVMQAFRIPQLAPFAVTGVTGNVSFDPIKVFYFGHSQGSNVGVPAVAVASEPKGAILSGAGAFLIEGILNKTSPVDAKAGLQFLLGEELTGSHPVMTIWQTYFDRADTLHFAPLMFDRPPPGIPSKHVFMTWAADDTFSPKPTLNIMARTMRLAIANPTLETVGALASIARPVSLNRAASDTDRTAALFQYQSDAYDGHFVSTRNPGAVVDWMAFLTSGFNGAPTVP